MEKAHKFYGFISLVLSIILLVSLFSCKKNTATDADIGNTTSAEITDNSVSDDTDALCLIENKKCNFKIVYPSKPTKNNLDAATAIKDHLMHGGIDAEFITDWDQKKNDPNAIDILVGVTKFNPEIKLSFDLLALGRYGFVIKAVDNKIVLLAKNDDALIKAAEYLNSNILKLEKDKITVEKDYFYISSDGLLLKELILCGNPISDYSLACDSEDLKPSADILSQCISEKTSVSLPSEGKHKIRLTTEGADGHTVSARFEDGDLVIRAKDSEDMKKAVVCFWYENVANETGSLELSVDMSYSRDLAKTVFYSDFGVKQSENECCLDAIIAAHNYANQNQYKVFADYNGRYYISSYGKTAAIKTDVEWCNAKFTIDDSAVTPDHRFDWIFNICSDLKGYSVNLNSIGRDATNLGVTLHKKSIVTLYDSTTTHYIRKGANADAGQTKQDSVIVSPDGAIDMSAPLMWDFDKITSVSVLPIDEKTITVSGGTFITVANQAPSEYTYYARGILITRSNTNLKSLHHIITGEIGHGAPYNGFIMVSNAAYVNVENCILSAHKIYKTANVSMGTYDIGASNAITLTFKNCYQYTDIDDKSLWGIMGTNYCKNITYDTCVLSRFDAHKGVANATIKNSIIGRWGASIIGYGTLLIENSEFHSNAIINLREDYGSSWDGDVIIRNCRIDPLQNADCYVIDGSNVGDHDFGYTCYIPRTVTIDGLYVNTVNDVYVFGNINSKCTSEDYSSVYAPVASEKVTVKNYSSTNASDIKLSPNMILFGSTQLIKE